MQPVRLVDKNYQAIHRAYYGGKKGIILEGSSGSGKTWASLKFLMSICGVEDGLTINAIRQTYSSFKGTLYDDLGRLLRSAPMVKNPFIVNKDIATYSLFTSRINFLGADNPDNYEGKRCDIAYYNEMLDIEKEIYQAQNQRTRKFFIGDYNPKTTHHYVYQLEKDPEIVFFRSTFRDNIMLSANERQNILSYEPTEYNISMGTADKFRWSVYGLGERCARTGLVHPNVTWITTFPPDSELDNIGYGLDFGFTNSPTAIVKVGRKGNNLFVVLMYYTPIADSNRLIEVVNTILPKGQHITCDSSDNNNAVKTSEAIGFIELMRRAGINAIPASKFPGSVKFGIDMINKHKLHYVENVDLRTEQENRVWEYIGGIPTNRPVKGFDHAHDALWYCLQTDFQN